MIGLSVITYNRPHYLQECLYSLDKNSWGGAVVKLVTVDEEFSSKYDFLLKYAEDNPDVTISFAPNGGVAKAKNRALQSMLNRGCTDLFLMEDDILMKSFLTCNHYRQAAKERGLHHMNFALHGPMNKGKAKIMKWHGRSVVVYPDCVGAFSYYTRECIEKVGLLDENFKNAWEHVEHSWRIAEAGMTTPFWYFVDCPGSETLLEEIPGSIDESSIRVRPDWAENIQKGYQYWVAKHGKWLPKRPVW